MAEIDRIKALAGLLDDDDDDLFPSSSNEEENEGSFDHDSSQAKPNPQAKECTSVPVSNGRHGVVKTQQQDDILNEMHKKLNVVKKDAPNTPAPQQPKSSPIKTAVNKSLRSKLGQPRLTIQTNQNENPPNEEEEADHLIFGRPQTFGAAGGYTTDYMPNVKERAVAISAWKILEMKKERKNGHARAKEWAVRDEREYCEDEEENDENVDTNEPKEDKSKNKGKVPSFLAQFDKEDENTENSVNGVVMTPTTPRGGVRVPLSPRNPPVLSPRNVSPRDIGVGPRNILSPRGVGIGMSPRNQSPKSDGRHSINKLKVNVAASPRNKIMSPRNQVLSPRTNALLSPSLAAGKSLQVKPAVVKASMGNKPPMSPRAIMTNSSKSTPTKQKEEAVTAPSQAKVTSGSKPIVKTAAPIQDESASKPQSVKFNGVKVMGELASALERRYAKSGVPDSPVTRKEPGDDAKHEDVNYVVDVKQPGEDDKSSVDLTTNHGTARASVSNESKSIKETLEEASLFLQHSEAREELIQEDRSSDSMDSNIDEELSAAAELARALDKLLVGSDLSGHEESDGVVSNGQDAEAGVDCDAMTDLSDAKYDTNQPVRKPESNDRSGRRVSFEDEQTKGWDQWNLAGQQNNKADMFAFPTDFSDFTTSNGDDSFFGASFSGEENSHLYQDQPKAAGPSTSMAREHKKSPKVKVNLKINGAAALKIDKDNDESMFFVSQPSPSCEDNAGLLQIQNGSSSPKAPEASLDRVVRDTPKKRGVVLNSPTKKRLNNLGLKLGLINNAVPSKSERGKGGDSPSMAGLLNNSNTASAVSDENVGMVSVRELSELTPNNQQSGHFFEAPSSPIMFSSSLALGSPMNAKPVQAEFSGGKKKKASNIFQRIKSPLIGRKAVRGAELTDDASI